MLIMEKTSGLVVDAYDDPSGALLRSIWQTPEQVPDQVKVAHHCTGAELTELPDHLYALILHNGDTVLRKFACVDAGNTEVHTQCLLKTAAKLPVEATKVAAANIAAFRQMYHMPEDAQLSKLALSLGTVANVGLTAATLPGSVGEVKQRHGAAKASGSTINPGVLGPIGG